MWPTSNMRSSSSPTSRSNIAEKALPRDGGKVSCLAELRLPQALLGTHGLCSSEYVVQIRVNSKADRIYSNASRTQEGRNWRDNRRRLGRGSSTSSLIILWPIQAEIAVSHRQAESMHTSGAVWMSVLVYEPNSRRSRGMLMYNCVLVPHLFKYIS